MAHIDFSYIEIVDRIFTHGRTYEDPNRKGVKRLQISKFDFAHNLQLSGFPALTLKELYWKGIVGELIWFLRGDTSVKTLNGWGIKFWDKDAYKYSEDGDCGRIYGAQWRNRKKIIDGVEFRVDQFRDLVDGMINNPHSTSLIVDAWNPEEVDKMALPPCHKGFQVMMYKLTRKEKLFYKTQCDYGFDLVWEQRSVDTFLGLPFNIASYATIAHFLGVISNSLPINLLGDLRNVHLYDNQLKEAKHLLTSVNPLLYGNSEVELLVGDLKSRFEESRGDFDKIANSLSIGDFKLIDYNSHPPLKVEMLSRD